uniref:Uncharacterized protein n=1 Tax=Cyanothece sp. (strain PCC 7425 / ATCC 29141) TaxID=395961 RepID=B8HW22_CYAP4
MFAHVCKFLAESLPADFATGLLGDPIPLTKLEPTELFLEPIRWVRIGQSDDSTMTEAGD